MSGVSLDVLITAALIGQSYNHERLGREARRYARKLSNRFAGDLPEDLHEEVFNEAFVQLWTKGAAALDGATGRMLFRRAVLNAIRVVKASYTPPGQRTRSVSDGAALGHIAAEDVGRIPDAETIERCSVGEGSTRAFDFDLFESPAAAAEVKAIENRIEVEAILSAAPVRVATALKHIYLDESSANAVAARFGLSRFAMRREIGAFAEMWRLAA